MTKEVFNLSHFITDSLNLQSNGSPARMMFPSKRKDHHLNIFEQDPLHVLGEHDFGKPKVIPEEAVGTPIQEFYRGANVLITGGTGFLGKVLTEKLIRSVPHLGHVYILIRPKRGKSSKERLDELLEDRVFSRVKTEVPDYLTKLSFVEGDISKPNLGLNTKDLHLLLGKVDVIFHSAADVRFGEPLKSAIKSNVLGSRNVLELAKKLKNLKSYVHVSTAYSQCVRREIEETIPKMSINYKEVLNDIESKTDVEIEDNISRITLGWPNTYTFSKAVCEDMIQEEAEGLPVCIVRPSVGNTVFQCDVKPSKLI